MQMKTIQMTIDPQLLKAVDKLTRLRKTTRSALIRAALESELRRDRVRKMETSHIAGYTSQPAAPGEFDSWVHEQDWGA
jgi:metal-responsive CopG/Arc/MetJ family transcriptional regulator